MSAGLPPAIERIQPRRKLGIECLHRIAAEPDLSRDERHLLLSCVFAYADFDDKDAREFDRIVTDLETEEVQDVRMSMTERWRREGLAMGIEQGREQGLAQGREQGLNQGRESIRELVLRLHGERFGSLSQDVRRRVAAIASAEELMSLAKRMDQVDSLEELGLA